MVLLLMNKDRDSNSCSNRGARPESQACCEGDPVTVTAGGSCVQKTEDVEG